ncbi:MAG TPA: DUF58 domain-containing protein [Polyangiaceae bacterium]|nr:DUF58 domain-containing protein [Polyangiaceae bacterium]
MGAQHQVSRDFDWNQLGTLRLRANAIADGLYIGIHRSARRGVGVEFAGRRNYVPGDDLRWLDRHALMRHGKLLVREFETDTERLLYLVMDATASMDYRGPGSSVSKWSYAATIAAALTRIALAGGDPVALDWIGGENARWLPGMRGREAFERVVEALESTRPGSHEALSAQRFERALAPVTRYARRGTIVIVLSDLIDLPEGAVERLSELSGERRSLVVVRVLDAAEMEFPFRGASRFVSLEGGLEVETDASMAQAAYLEALRNQSESIRTVLAQRGGRLLTVNTSENPIEAVRAVVDLSAARRR